ncbi:DJ-1/PfpI family protein [bacterium]|nr:DJ-1/PfpI family protein [bacterium]
MPGDGYPLRLKGKKIAVLIESDYYEHEIWYYHYRFPEEGAEVHFLSRLWGNKSLEFKGHEYKAPFACTMSFEDVRPTDYAAVIVPSGIVADRLRYSETPTGIPPALKFLQAAFAEKAVLKGIICHGMWLVAKAPALVKGRPVTCHNNLVGDVAAYGAKYTDQDVVVDGDLVTARTGDHAGLFAHTIIDLLTAK